MAGKNFLGITCRAALVLVAAWTGLTSTAAAGWDRVHIGGGSMKRALFDANNDGWLDSLSVNNWYKNPKDGTGGWETISTGWSTGNHYKDGYHVGCPNMASIVDGQRAGDINGDGRPDMVVGVPGTDWGTTPPTDMQNNIYAAINPGDEGEWDFYYIGELTPWKEDGVETVAIGDMNNDGRPDILAGGECHKLRWYVNPGPPEGGGQYDIKSDWSYHTVTDLGVDVEGMAVGHFDNDDYLDIAVVGASSWGTPGGVYVLKNPQTETGSWARKTVSSSRCSVIETIAGGKDINGDGRNDVVLATRQLLTDSYLYWYENPEGAGSWTEHLIGSLDLDQTGLVGVGQPPELSDVDRDGDYDVICYCVDDLKTYWYENTNGDGTSWEKREIYGTGMTYYGVGDVDKNGGPDIICGGYWYINPVPEPSTVALLLIGIVCLAALAVRRKLKCR